MKAKEMFEKLGYKERKEEYKNDKIYAITYVDYENGNRITITKEKIEIVKDRTKGYLEISVLPAINKQVEELGWYE